MRGELFCGEPQAAAFPLESFDRVGMFDVLAHLAQPRETLRAAAALLKPGGAFVLSTTNEDWPLVPAFHWLFRAAPEASARLRDEMYEGQHYCYFGSGNVGTLLDSAGLRLERWEPLLPLSARFFVHQYGHARRLALLFMGRVDRWIGSSRKMMVLARKARTGD